MSKNHHNGLHLICPSFTEGFPVPRDYTADGQNASPPLAWTDPPEGTRSFALVCDDPDAPRGTWVHWVVWNIPADARELPPGLPPEASLSNGARQGSNDFGRIGYGGPAPPPGKPHRYFFKLYALDTLLALDGGATKEQLLEAIRGHQLAEGRLFGVYSRTAKE